MDRVLSGIPRQQCLVYLDDILAHGSSFDSALESLRQVLGRIRAAGLKLHPEKCHFMRKEVQFLGHTVGGGGHQHNGGESGGGGRLAHPC